LKWEQRKLKNQKNGKPVHGVMICDVLPMKNTKHGIPILKKKNSSRKMAPGRTSLGFLSN
jgi:hypothetical protein